MKSEQRKREEEVVNIAKELGLLNQRVYFSVMSDVEEYGSYATFKGFVYNFENLNVAVSFIKDPYKILLFHPSRFKEFCW